MPVRFPVLGRCAPLGPQKYPKPRNALYTFPSEAHALVNEMILVWRLGVPVVQGFRDPHIYISLSLSLSLAFWAEVHGLTQQSIRALALAGEPTLRGWVISVTVMIVHW